MHTVDVNGAEIPALGFGTFELLGKTATDMVKTAIAYGYRHIDTAQIYRNERAVGEAIANADVQRDEIFLTTKVWTDYYHSADLLRSVEASLLKLQTSYVDLLLLHWPNPRVPLEETITALNAAKEDGITKHIGVSNFTTTLLRQATELSDTPLIVNQVEYHPLLNQDKLLRDMRHYRMVLTAYSPLAKGKVFNEPTLARIGENHRKSPGQVTLRWLIQQDGVTAIPRTSNKQNAKENLEIFDFSLSPDEMSEISALTNAQQRLVNPANLRPDWDM